MGFFTEVFWCEKTLCQRAERHTAHTMGGDDAPFCDIVLPLEQIVSAHEAGKRSQSTGHNRTCRRDKVRRAMTADPYIERLALAHELIQRRYGLCDGHLGIHSMVVED